MNSSIAWEKIEKSEGEEILKCIYHVGVYQYIE
jgi:hypothetical protein